MKQEMIVCDNPNCDEVSSDAYGWIAGNLFWVGTGPTVHVEVCSEECLSLGLEAARDRQEYEAHEKQRTYEAELNAAILQVSCPTCDAPTGVLCQSKYGRSCLRPHAPRMKAGRDAMQRV